MRVLPVLLLVAACAPAADDPSDTDTPDPTPLCQGDPAGVVGWSIGGGMLDVASNVLAPRGHLWFELDADCGFLAWDGAEAWSAWHAGTLTADQAEELRARLDLDRWPTLTTDAITAGEPFPDGSTSTFTAGGHAASCGNCTELASDLAHVAREVADELYAAGEPIVPRGARVATFADGEGFVDDERALHVTWEATTAWTAWQYPDGDSLHGYVAPEADVPWLLDVWAQQAGLVDPRYLIGADVGDGTRVGLAVRPVP